MADLSKELFEIGSPDFKRKYHFIDIYENKSSVELDFGDRLSLIQKCLRIITKLTRAKVNNQNGK